MNFDFDLEVLSVEENKIEVGNQESVEAGRLRRAIPAAESKATPELSAGTDEFEGVEFALAPYYICRFCNLYCMSKLRYFWHWLNCN